MKPRRLIDEDAIRRPPAYQEYGSDLLGLESVRLMDLNERGLLATIRWFCWANDSIPADPALMARVLGLCEAGVKAALTARVLAFLRPTTADPLRLHSPELSAQMADMMEKRIERAASGSKGGKSSQRKRKLTEAELQAELERSSKLSEKSRDEKSRDELCKEADISNTSKQGNVGGSDAAWTADYLSTEKVSPIRHGARQ